MGRMHSSECMSPRQGRQKCICSEQRHGFAKMMLHARNGSMHDLLIASFDFHNLGCFSFTYTNSQLLAPTEASIHYFIDKLLSSEPFSSESIIRPDLKLGRSLAVEFSWTSPFQDRKLIPVTILDDFHSDLTTEL